MPAFVVADVFRGSLSEDRVLDSGVDLSLKLSAEVETLEEQDLAEDLFTGFKGRSTVDWRFRGDLTTPVSLDHNNQVSLLVGSPALFAEETLRVSYPFHVWNADVSRFYSLGGVDSIRGYRAGDLTALRYALLSTCVRRSGRAVG